MTIAPTTPVTATTRNNGYSNLEIVTKVKCRRGVQGFEACEIAVWSKGKFLSNPLAIPDAAEIDHQDISLRFSAAGLAHQSL